MEVINNWIEKKEQQMFDGINTRISEQFSEIGTDIWNGFIYILPDIVGLGVMVASGFLMVSPLIGKTMASKVMGWTAAGSILAMSVLIYAKGA